MAMLTMRARRFLQKTGRNLEANKTTSIRKMKNQQIMPSWHLPPQVQQVLQVLTVRDNALVELRKKFEAAEKERDELKHTLEKFQTSSKNLNVSVPTSLLHDRYKSSEGYHVVPPPYTGTFMPPKPDLVFHDASTVSETVPTVFNVKPSTTKPTKDKSQSYRPSVPVIKDWVSDSEDEYEAVLTRSRLVPLNTARPVTTNIPQTNVKHQRPANHVINKPHSPIRRPINHRPAPKNSNFHQKVTTIKPKNVNVVQGTKGNWGNPQQALKDKEVIDSGYLRHMTGSISYLSDFEEINGGYVAFGGNPKGGKMTGKGKIKIGKLDFDDVYFIKELKFNLFSVSQMCDKKNNVHFTDTECVVLSSDFKLFDENHVLLRVPRENNMYNVDLKNIVPLGDLTCFFAKAILDESNLWHRRLGHINFKTMNKLVKTINGGYVAFCGNPKGGKITGKGKIRTGKLDFDDVYFVKELKFNLLSDENHVLLRVLRENNMYNVDLKNIVPSGDSTCLFAKATLDESNLWHRRLSYINFKTLNKLVKGNLVRGLPSKFFKNNHTCVACKKGKQHRASCKTKPVSSVSQPLQRMKGIKREFSVARTPQQNGIAKRKNRTLIEVARTMLTDSLLPIPFWAEAVNTACYVQNRVLVTKPHNKTPYELLLGRPPSIGFMRPFGCPVTIINTLDPLGKFDGKADEGFLVGYSVSSKAFQVFNIRTRIVQET
nr:retrovirus-related Pol polyprotein from transposon TNT 1-94 [Tanacetum cinerariifolium]